MLYLVETFCNDEFYEHKIVDIQENEEDFDPRDIERATGYDDGICYREVYTEEEFKESFGEEEQAEMLEEYNAR